MADSMDYTKLTSAITAAFSNNAFSSGISSSFGSSSLTNSIESAFNKFKARDSKSLQVYDTYLADHVFNESWKDREKLKVANLENLNKILDERLKPEYLGITELSNKIDSLISQQRNSGFDISSIVKLTGEVSRLIGLYSNNQNNTSNNAANNQNVSSTANTPNNGLSSQFIQSSEKFYGDVVQLLSGIHNKITVEAQGNNSWGSILNSRGVNLAGQAVLKTLDIIEQKLRPTQNPANANPNTNTAKKDKDLTDSDDDKKKKKKEEAENEWYNRVDKWGNRINVVSKELLGFNVVIKDVGSSFKDTDAIIKTTQSLLTDLWGVLKKFTPLGGILGLVTDAFSALLGAMQAIIQQPIKGEFEKQNFITESVKSVNKTLINQYMADYDVGLEGALEIIYNNTVKIQNLPYKYKSSWDQLFDRLKTAQSLVRDTSLPLQMVDRLSGVISYYKDYQQLGADLQGSEVLKTGSKLYAGIDQVIDRMGATYKQIRDTMNASIQSVSQQFNQNFARYYTLTSPNQEALLESSTSMIKTLGKLNASVIDANDLLNKIVSNRDKMASDFFESDFGKFILMNTDDPWGIKDAIDSGTSEGLQYVVDSLKSGVLSNFSEFTAETAKGEEFATMVNAYQGGQYMDLIRSIIVDKNSDKSLQEFVKGGGQPKDRLEALKDFLREEFDKNWEKTHQWFDPKELKLRELSESFTKGDFVEKINEKFAWDRIWGADWEKFRNGEVHTQVLAKFFGEGFQKDLVTFATSLIGLTNSIFVTLVGMANTLTGVAGTAVDGVRYLAGRINEGTLLKNTDIRNSQIVKGGRQVEIGAKYAVEFAGSAGDSFLGLASGVVPGLLSATENYENLSQDQKEALKSDYIRKMGLGRLSSAFKPLKEALNPESPLMQEDDSTPYVGHALTALGTLGGIALLSGQGKNLLSKGWNGLTSLASKKSTTTVATNATRTATDTITQTGKLGNLTRTASGGLRLGQSAQTAGNVARNASTVVRSTGTLASGAGSAGNIAGAGAGLLPTLGSSVGSLWGAGAAGIGTIAAGGIAAGLIGAGIGTAIRKTFNTDEWNIFGKGLREGKVQDVGLNTSKFSGLSQDEWLAKKREENQIKANKTNSEQTIKSVKDSAKQNTDTAVQQGTATRKQIQFANEYLSKLGNLTPKLTDMVMPAIIFFNKFNNNLAGQLNTYLSGMIELIKEQKASLSESPSEESTSTENTGGGEFRGYQGGSVFTYRQSGAYRENRGNHLHNGIDFAAPGGTPLPATEDAVVADLEHNPAKGGGYGKLVFLKGLKSGMYIGYAHLSEVNVNRIGQKVSAGEMIGRVGNTGHSFGDHLHFMVGTNVGFPASDINSTINPLDYLAGKNINVKNIKGKKGAVGVMGGLSRLPGFGWLTSSGGRGLTSNVNSVTKLVSESESAGALDAVRDAYDKGYGKYQLTYLPGEFDNWGAFVRWLGKQPQYKTLYEHLKGTNGAIPSTVKPAMTYLTTHFRSLWEQAQDDYIVKNYLDVLGSTVNNRGVPFRSAALSFSVLHGPGNVSRFLRNSGALGTADDTQALIKLYRYALANLTDGGFYTGRYTREAKSLGIYDEVMYGNRKGDGEGRNLEGILYNLTEPFTSTESGINVLSNILPMDYQGLRPFLANMIYTGSWMRDEGSSSIENDMLSQLVDSQHIADIQTVWNSQPSFGNLAGYSEGNAPSGLGSVGKTVYALGGIDAKWGLKNRDKINIAPSSFGLKSGANVSYDKNDPFMQGIGKTDWWQKTEKGREGRLVKKGNAYVWSYEEEKPAETKPAPVSAPVASAPEAKLIPKKSAPNKEEKIVTEDGVSLTSKEATAHLWYKLNRNMQQDFEIKQQIKKSIDKNNEIQEKQYEQTKQMNDTQRMQNAQQQVYSHTQTAPKTTGMYNAQQQVYNYRNTNQQSTKVHKR